MRPGDRAQSDGIAVLDFRITPIFARSLCLAALVLATPAAAQDRTAALARLLGEVPVVALGEDGSATIGFGDLVVGYQSGLRRRLAYGADEYLFDGMVRVMPPRFGQDEIFRSDEMTERYGFGPADLEAMLEVSAPGHGEVVVIDLVEPRAEAVAATLTGQGFETVTMFGTEVLVRGEDDNHIDIENQHAPFGLGLGFSARVVAEADLVRHATSWVTMNPMLAGWDNLADHPTLAALLQAVEAAPIEAGPLAGAVLHYGYPADMVEAVLIADFSGRRTDHAVMAIALADAGAATALAGTIEANWADAASPMTVRPFAEMLLRLQVEVLPGEVAAVVLTTDTPVVGIDDMNFNRGYRTLSTLVLSGDLDALMAPR